MKKKLFAILMSAMMLVAFMPAMAFAGNWIGSRSASTGNEVDVETMVFYNIEMQKAGGYKLIDTKAMKGYVDKKAAGKNIVIIDAMPESTWKSAHIPGAVSCEAPMGKWMGQSSVKWGAGQKAALKKAVGYKSKAKAKKDKKTIVVYCGFCKCDRSHFAAKYIKSLGYKNVLRYVGGGAGWEDAGYDLENAAGEVVKPHEKPAA